jgi:hypothetical protein
MPEPGGFYPEYVFRVRCGRARAECWWRVDEHADLAKVHAIADEMVAKIVSDGLPIAIASSGHP